MRAIWTGRGDRHPLSALDHFFFGPFNNHPVGFLSKF
jgi:hypothetical protein